MAILFLQVENGHHEDTVMEKVNQIWQSQYSDLAKGRHPFIDRWVKHTPTFSIRTRENITEYPDYAWKRIFTIPTNSL